MKTPPLALVVALASACHPGHSEPPAPPPLTPETPRCGGGERFVGDLPIPPGTRLAILLDTGPTLDAALVRLGEASRAGIPGLALFAGFALSQLSREATFVRDFLQRGGFTPGQLLRVSDAAGNVAWTYRLGCDLDLARQAASTAWRLEIHRGTDGLTAQPQAAADGPFAWITLPGDHLALVPATTAARATSWARGSAGASGADVAASARLRELLGAVAALPVRVAVSGVAFVSGSGGPVEALAADASGLRLGASLPSP